MRYEGTSLLGFDNSTNAAGWIKDAANKLTMASNTHTNRGAALGTTFPLR
jgi:hypothetical protein